MRYLSLCLALATLCLPSVSAATTTLWRDDFTTYSGYSTFEGFYGSFTGTVTRSAVADPAADDGWALLVESDDPAIVTPFTYKTITLPYAVSTITVRARFRAIWGGSGGHMAVVSIYDGTISPSNDLKDYGGTYNYDALFAWSHDGVSTTYKPIGSTTHTFASPVSQITIVLENGDTRNFESSYGYWDWIEVTTEEERPSGPGIPALPNVAFPVAFAMIISMRFRKRA